LKERPRWRRAWPVEGYLAPRCRRLSTVETNPDVPFIGVSPESFAARTGSWRRRALLASGYDSARRSVFWAIVWRKSFSLRHRVGRKIKFRGINYSVAACSRPKAALLAAIKTGSWRSHQHRLNRYGARYRSLSILVQAQNQPLFEDTMEQVRGALRMIRKVPPGEPDDFELFTNDSLITQFRSITLAARIGRRSSVPLHSWPRHRHYEYHARFRDRAHREIGIRRAVGPRSAIS